MFGYDDATVARVLRLGLDQHGKMPANCLRRLADHTGRILLDGTVYSAGMW